VWGCAALVDIVSPCAFPRFWVALTAQARQEQSATGLTLGDHGAATWPQTLDETVHAAFRLLATMGREMATISIWRDTAADTAPKMLSMWCIAIPGHPPSQVRRAL
jgi:hypothetical protein